MLARTVNTILPMGVDVSTCSDRLTNSMPRLRNVSSARSKCDTDRAKRSNFQTSDPVLAIPLDFVRTQGRNSISGKSGGGVPPDGKNASAAALSKKAVPDKTGRRPATKAKVQNVHSAEITDADVQFPGDVA